MRGWGGTLVSEGLAYLFLPHCAASLQAAPGCVGSLAGCGRRGEFGSAGVLEEACPSAAPRTGGRAASLRRLLGLDARVACLSLLASSHPVLELWRTGCSVPNVPPCTWRVWHDGVSLLKHPDFLQFCSVGHSNTALVAPLYALPSRCFSVAAGLSPQFGGVGTLCWGSIGHC